MSQKHSQALRQRIETELPHLRALDDRSAALPRGPGKWCPKEELGHLIDSASNNHQRFVRAALALEYRGPGYAQDEWVALHGYIDLPWELLLSFWYEYNLLLAGLITRISDARLETLCFIGDGAPVTLAFVIEDYALHMQHHIDQLLRREKVTAYPGAAAKD